MHWYKNPKGVLCSFVRKAIPLKQHFRSEDVCFAIEQVRGVWVNSLFAVFNHCIELTLPAQEPVSGFMETDKSLLHRVKRAINEHQTSAGIEHTEDFAQCAFQEPSRFLPKSRKKGFSKHIFCNFFDLRRLEYVIYRGWKSSKGIRLEQRFLSFPLNAIQLTRRQGAIVWFSHHVPR